MNDLLNQCKKALKKTSHIHLVEERMQAINKALRAYGVESINGEKYCGYYWQNCCALYVNMGDTYLPTILYNVVTGKYSVTSWGDWVEKHNDKYKIF